MRTFWRTPRLPALDRDILRDITMVCVADSLVGVSFGAIAVAGGLPLWVPVTMSVLVFAGGSQIAAVGVVLAGGSPVAAVAAGLLLNTRLLPYSLAVADLFTGRWPVRLAGAQLTTDETVAFALGQRDPARQRAAFWICGVSLFACWNAAVAAGAFAGSAIKDTGAFGLDAAFPAVLLALVLPSLTDRGIRRAAAGGAVIAVAATPFLPAGVPVLLALAALVLAGRPAHSPGAVAGAADPVPVTGGRAALDGQELDCAALDQTGMDWSVPDWSGEVR
jgi:4-azaleucine resistance transporter AzlC